MTRRKYALALVLFAIVQPAVGEGWRPFASAAPWIQGSADLDGGGDFRAAGLILRAGATRPFGNGHQAGLTFSYDFTDYRFSSPAAFGGLAPWDDVHRVGLSTPFVIRGTGGWGFLVTPSLDYLMEEGASSSDALSYGAVLAASRRFDADLQLGLGFGIFDQLEEVKVFPFIVVDWKLGERWRLANPLPAGPTGGGGLELNYRFDAGWTLGGGAAYRSVRFRLSDQANEVPVRYQGILPDLVREGQGVVAQGVLGADGVFVASEVLSVAAFLHAARDLGPDSRLGLYAGALFAGELRVESASGDELARQDFDPAPFFGAALTLRY